jgi:hypothetical protein
MYRQATSLRSQHDDRKRIYRAVNSWPCSVCKVRGFRRDQCAPVVCGGHDRNSRDPSGLLTVIAPASSSAMGLKAAPTCVRCARVKCAHIWPERIKDQERPAHMAMPAGYYSTRLSACSTPHRCSWSTLYLLVEPLTASLDTTLILTPHRCSWSTLYLLVEPLLPHRLSLDTTLITINTLLIKLIYKKTGEINTNSKTTNSQLIMIKA